MPARIVAIDDADAPALQPYTAIRERDLVGRDRLFVAEGEVVVRVLALRSKLVVRSFLIEERRVSAIHDVLAHAADDVPAYVVPQAVMDRVVGFSIHRGILALGERGPAFSASELLLGASVVVCLVGLTNHDNVGGIFRSAAAFGANAILLDDATCDPLYRKAIRVSVGAALLVPFARCGSVDAMLDAVGAAGLEAIALTPRGEEAIDALPPVSGGRALLLGTEGPGLPDAVLARTRRVRIDMAGGLDSLNVGVAGAVALHEVTRALRLSAARG